MKASLKPWQIGFAVTALIVVLVVMWMRVMGERAPQIVDVPRGHNAENALKINMDGH